MPATTKKSLCWVYPRPCGGTGIFDVEHPRAEGLSPPVRGNRRPSCRPELRGGSIPARAGEPGWLGSCLLLSGVYPRPCGGTLLGIERGTVGLGLSPPVRGNPARSPALVLGRGSIPARAGEPAMCSTIPNETRVYPRPCGGTCHSTQGYDSPQGLSPPVRGNRLHADVRASLVRSIPARAGEPTALRERYIDCEVYPRPCGGTHQARTDSFAVLGLSPPVRGNP